MSLGFPFPKRFANCTFRPVVPVHSTVLEDWRTVWGSRRYGFTTSVKTFLLQVLTKSTLLWRKPTTLPRKEKRLLLPKPEQDSGGVLWHIQPRSWGLTAWSFGFATSTIGRLTAGR